MKAAIVYSGEIRDNGTPRLFREAFAEVLGHELPWFTRAGEIPAGHSFYFSIDDGRDDLSRNPPSPWGFYCTDSHLGMGPRLEKARQADIVWCAQADAAVKFKEDGINAHWLPLACAPYHHATASELGEETKAVYDIAFVGHLQPPKDSSRIEFLDSLAQAVQNFRYEFGVFGLDMARVYHKARIGVNHAVRNDLNMRFFELASIGVPQLCDERMLGLKDLGFEPWRHFIPYGGPWPENSVAEDAIGAIKWALKYPGGLGDMAKRAHDLVRSQHKYTDRVRVMLEMASGFIGEDLCGTSGAALSAVASGTPITTTTSSAPVAATA